MIKTICIPEELHKELVNLKLDERNKNMAEIIRNLILAYKEKKFLNNSLKFGEMLKRNRKNFSSLLKESRKIREEIADDWFS